MISLLFSRQSGAHAKAGGRRRMRTAWRKRWIRHGGAGIARGFWEPWNVEGAQSVTLDLPSPENSRSRFGPGRAHTIASGFARRSWPRDRAARPQKRGIVRYRTPAPPPPPATRGESSTRHNRFREVETTARGNNGSNYERFLDPTLRAFRFGLEKFRPSKRPRGAGFPKISPRSQPIILVFTNPQMLPASENTLTDRPVTSVIRENLPVERHPFPP